MIIPRIIPRIIHHENLFLPFLQKTFEKRPFFQWLTIVFNKIDMDRIKEFGPDRVCAEWCLKNGAAVQWVGEDEYLKDYNSLPPEGSLRYIRKIDATDSSISHHGFLHLRGCNHIREVILNNCGYLENEGLHLLYFIKSSLQHLQVANCGNINDTGLLHLKDLTNLQTLELYQLRYVKNKQNVLQVLKQHLPGCKIIHDFEGKRKESIEA